MKGLCALMLFICYVQDILIGQVKTITIHDNNLILSISSDGRIFQDENGNPAFYKKGYEEINFLSSSGLIMYGTDIFSGRPLIVENNRRDARLLHLHSGLNYITGDIALADEVFFIDKQTIQDHIQDYVEDGVVDNPNDRIFLWPGRGNQFMNQVFDWNDHLLHMNLAPFADLNDNNIYEPQYGEFPALTNYTKNFYRMPESIYWFATTTKNEIFVEAPQVNVYHTVYTYECDDKELLNNTICIDYEIYNYGNVGLDGFYIGHMDKVNLGCEDQVRLNTDSASKAWHAYRDSTCYDAEGYNPVLSRYSRSGVIQNNFALGEIGMIDTLIIGIQGIRYFDRFLDEATNMSDLIQECEHISQGLWADGSPFVGVGNGYDPISTDTVFYAFDGDVIRETGWNEYDSQVEQGERWVLSRNGKTLLQSKGTTSISVAYTINVFKNGEPVYDLLNEQAFDIDFIFRGIDYGVGCDDSHYYVDTLDEESMDYFTIFPNPHSGEITILNRGNIQKIEVFSTYGQFLFTVEPEKLNKPISLDSGIHFLKIFGPNGYHWEKVIGITE